jgi:hypothetical protein
MKTFSILSLLVSLAAFTGCESGNVSTGVHQLSFTGTQSRTTIDIPESVSSKAPAAVNAMVAPDEGVADDKYH